MMPLMYGSYGSYKTMTQAMSSTSILYDKYFENAEYYTHKNGSESFLYTKGNKNSLIQTIMYLDELAKAMKELEEKEREYQPESLQKDVKQYKDKTSDKVEAAKKYKPVN